ncbi:MAG: hypothetical protein M3Y57_17805 [Acidobacteriota bacterium]|nr:hypothetical protein [Acidobacteriota bacterium]
MSTFEALKRREIAFQDPVWEHIEHCSPCYCQFADIREGLFKQDRINGVRTTARNLLIVAVLALGAVASIYLWRHHDESVNRTAIGSTHAEAAVLNFEDGSELRGPGAQQGTGANPNSSVQHLPRNELNLTVYLPLGSPGGEYELEISRVPSETVWSARGLAKIKDGLTSIPVNGDLRDVQPGEYRFKFRRPGETWHEKNILVR